MRVPVWSMIILASAFMATGVYVQQSLDGPELSDQEYQPIEASLTTPDLPSNIIGNKRPDFSLPDVTGTIRNISEWDGKLIAVNFWATWCLPCLKEIPELVDLQARYGDQGFQVIGIALQRPDELGEFINDHKMNYPVLAGEAAVILVAESYGNLLGALPYTAIIDPTGKVVFTKAGPVTGTEVEEIIKEILQ